VVGEVEGTIIVAHVEELSADEWLESSDFLLKITVLCIEQAGQLV
jgi:hypothetical protein